MLPDRDRGQVRGDALTGPVGGFFARVEWHDKAGFYGPCDRGVGLPIPGGSLPPPDLVIRDESHLTSGLMGTMVGLYEAALDELCRRDSCTVR